MRVAHIITRMIIGGAQENTLFNCLDLIEQHGDEVLLVTGPALGPEGDLLSRFGLMANGQGRAGELQIDLLPPFRRNINPIRDWMAATEIRRSLQRFRPDVVHTHSAKGGLLGRRVAWSMGVPAVIHSVHGAPFHDYQPALARAFFVRCERHAAKRCHHMISVADAMTDLMVESGVATREKFTTIYSGMDVAPFESANTHRDAIRQKYSIANDRVVIGKIARLFHLKGHDDLITAAQHVVEQCPNVIFMLVGDGILRESLKNRIDSMGLSEHFVFTGLVSPDQVPELIGAMDVLVHTSLREGLARALPQALIAGKPVVSFDIDGAREVVLNDVTGYLIPPRQTSPLSRSLIRLSRDPELRNRMGLEGQTRFTEQFRHESMTRHIRELYARILADK